MNQQASSSRIRGFYVGDTVVAPIWSSNAINIDKACDIHDLARLSVHERNLQTIEVNLGDETNKNKVGFYVSAKQSMRKKGLLLYGEMGKLFIACSIVRSNKMSRKVFKY